MKLQDVFARSVQFRSATFFLLAVFAGWSVFNLQAVSLVGLLQVAGIELLPAVMIFQSLSSWMLLRVWGNAAMDSSRGYFVTALFIGGSVAAVSHISIFSDASPLISDFHWSHPKVLVYCLLFIFSQLTIAAIRLGIHVTFSKQISVLRNPQVSTQLAISEEFGFLIGVLLLVGTQSGEGPVPAMMSVLPFSLSMILFSWLQTVGEKSRKDFLRDSHFLDKLKNMSRSLNPFSKDSGVGLLDSVRKPPYFYTLVGLFMIVATLKSLQWFGMAWGLTEASKSNDPMVTIFARMSLIQSLLTLTILVASLRFSSRIPTWGVGFKALFGAQGLVASSLMISPAPYALMSAEIFRKVLEHGFLGRSLQLLTSTLPESDRLEMRHILERWGTTTGTLLVGFVALFVIHGNLPLNILFLAAFVLALVGLRLRKKLFSILTDIHLAQLAETQASSVIQACYVLANPECRQHHAALTVLLEKSPRPAITKSALTALGRMKHPGGIPAIKNYVQHAREDIQVAAIKALQNFSGHEMNLTLLKTLRDLLRSDMVIRASVVKTLTDQLGLLAIPYLLEVLESNPNERVMGNTLEILGDIAKKFKDEDLMDYMSRYLDEKSPRRPRANATLFLLGTKKYGEKAQECFDRFMTSSDPKDQRSFAYVAGVLGLRGHESFVFKRSLEMEHKDPVLLTAMLRLGNPEAPLHLARLVSDTNEDLALDALVKISALELEQRARVFFEVLENGPDALGILFDRMRRSQRDFDSDRELVRQEALRLGIPLPDEGGVTLPPKKSPTRLAS